LVEQKFAEIGTVLASDSGDECAFGVVHDFD
jgi:hypothetical protein